MCMRGWWLQSCLTLCNPKDCSPPGSSAHGVFQARIRGWIAMPSSRGSSRPRDRTHASIFTTEPAEKPRFLSLLHILTNFNIFLALIPLNLDSGLEVLIPRKLFFLIRKLLYPLCHWINRQRSSCTSWGETKRLLCDEGRGSSGVPHSSSMIRVELNED